MLRALGVYGISPRWQVLRIPVATKLEPSLLSEAVEEFMLRTIMGDLEPEVTGGCFFMIADELQDVFSDWSSKRQRRPQVVELLRQQAAEEVFRLLWPVALDTLQKPADQWASELLVELEPWCPLTCEEALRAVAISELNLSNRLVPFYLCSQFGKRKVGKTYQALVQAEFCGVVPAALTVILYWLKLPAVELVQGFAVQRHQVLLTEP